MIRRPRSSTLFPSPPLFGSELVKANPDAIICAGDAAIQAAQAATTIIPIVASTDDMVGTGLVQSLARPGGNTTGVSILAARSEEHTSELQSPCNPVCRLLLE